MGTSLPTRASTEGLRTTGCPQPAPHTIISTQKVGASRKKGANRESWAKWVGRAAAPEQAVRRFLGGGYQHLIGPGVLRHLVLYWGQVFCS